jgi:hypothetical protein
MLTEEAAKWGLSVLVRRSFRKAEEDTGCHLSIPGQFTINEIWPCTIGGPAGLTTSRR